MRGRLHLGVALALSLVSSGCASVTPGLRDSRGEAVLGQLERASLEIGEFELAGSDSVIDGDTLRVRSLDHSMRLLAIDTEETFKHEHERRAFAEGWEQYKKKKRGGSSRPVKMATPVGEEAKHFARGFFEGVRAVRLERDHPGEIRDYYDRYLAYVLVQKNGHWVNYNLECVRAGLSPYFTKYGRSRRFHEAFLAAQAEAREAQRGIWDPTKQHYDDYDERLAWWNARAQAIARFEEQARDNDELLILTRSDFPSRFEKAVGKMVTVLGTVSQIKLGDSGPTVVKLSRSRGSDLEVVFFDRDLFLASGILKSKGELVEIRGMVTKSFAPFRNGDRLQLVSPSRAR